MSRQGMNDSDHHEGHRDAQRPRSHATVRGEASPAYPYKYPIQVPHSLCPEYPIAAANSRPHQRWTDRKARGAMVTGEEVRPSAEAWGRRARLAMAAVVAAVRVRTPSLAK